MPAVLSIVAVVVLGVAGPAAAQELPPGGTFTDDDFNTHEGNIEAIVAVGVTFGCDAVGPRYCPNGLVTRAQMASFLARAAGLAPVPGTRFADVSGTHAANINAIAGAGITLGCNPEGTLYCPNDSVTRAQMASFLARALGLAPVAGNRFTDVSSSHTANVNAIAEAGITLGCNPEGTLYCPDDFVTRAQMASFLARALGLDPIVPPPRNLVALVAGNDITADRINLIFAPWGWEQQQAFVALITGSLSWSGDPYLISEDQRITTVAAQATGAQMGLFSIEPWRSNRDRFNVWYTTVASAFPGEWVNATDHPFNKIPNVSVIEIGLDAHLSNPDLTSVSGQNNVFVGPEAPKRPATGNPFANSLAVIKGDQQATGLTDIPHELGHALFNLADEYVGQRTGFDGRADLSSWPSCAEDAAEANAWWGTLIGQIDPMMGIWANEMAEAGFPLDQNFLQEQVRVANVDQGCYAVAGSFRATQDSLMNSNMPVLGSVNRRWAQQILDLWAGKPRS